MNQLQQALVAQKVAKPVYPEVILTDWNFIRILYSTDYYLTRMTVVQLTKNAGRGRIKAQFRMTPLEYALVLKAYNSPDGLKVDAKRWVDGERDLQGFQKLAREHGEWRDESA
jgi:hypothetical protein